MFPNRSAAHIAAEMPKRRLTSPPDDLQCCIKCRKVLGDHGGWFGPQHMCDRPKSTRPRTPADHWGEHRQFEGGGSVHNLRAQAEPPHRLGNGIN